MTTSRIEIDLSALEHNLGVIRRVTGTGVGICAVLKQDGYGLGAARLAKRLSACGVEMLAVYTLDEARALVEAAVPTPILLLMPIRTIDRMDPVYRHAVAGKLHLTLHDAEQLVSLTVVAQRLGVGLPVHVQVDTGLARGGALPPVATRLVEMLTRTARVRLAGAMTHFASPCTDADSTREQAATFREWMETVKPMLPTAMATGTAGKVVGGAAGGPPVLLVHAANSCAMFRSAKYHGNMVRVGQSLHGFVGEEWGAPAGAEPGETGTEGIEFAAQAMELRPALRWTSSIVHVKEIPAGSPVGYGSTWRARRPTKIALVPVGYADGYPRSLSNTGMVGLTERQWDRPGTGSGGGTGRPPAPTHFAPVVGRVSMDQITLDVTDAPEAARRLGAEVEIIGADWRLPNHLPRLADKAGTITHELMCRIAARLERVYRFPAAAGAGADTPVRIIGPATPPGGLTGGTAVAR